MEETEKKKHPRDSEIWTANSAEFLILFNQRGRERENDIKVMAVKSSKQVTHHRGSK